MTLFPKRKPTLFDVFDAGNFRQILKHSASESGDAIAVKYKTKSTPHDVTYTELLSKVDSLGTGLMLLDPPPARAAVFASDGFFPVLALLTVLSMNAVAIPVDASLPLVEKTGILIHSDCDALFFKKEDLSAVLSQKKVLPGVRYFICYGLKEHEEDRANGLYAFSSLMEKGQNAIDEGDERFTALAPANEDDRLLFYKSGSADSLTGVMLSQGAVLSAARGFLQLNALQGRGLLLFPADHPYGLICGLIASLINGATVCLNSSLKAFQKELHEYAPDYLMLPPLYIENIWQKMVKTFESVGEADTFRTLVRTSNTLRKIGIDKRRVFFSKMHQILGGKLTKIYTGGAPINPDAVRFFDDVGVTVLGSFGEVECGALISAAREDDHDPESAGALLPCLQIMIDAPDENGRGEICVMGDTLMRGYYKNEEKTASVIDPAGWFHTGSVGSIDASGRISVTGKIKKEIVLKIGRTVDPEEIESYLAALPFVKSASVFAGKDARGAELHLCAELELDDAQFEGLTALEKSEAVKEKLDRLNDALPAYKRVKKVHIRKNVG